MIRKNDDSLRCVMCEGTQVWHLLLSDPFIPEGLRNIVFDLPAFCLEATLNYYLELELLKATLKIWKKVSSRRQIALLTWLFLTFQIRRVKKTFLHTKKSRSFPVWTCLRRNGWSGLYSTPADANPPRLPMTCGEIAVEYRFWQSHVEDDVFQLQLFK